MNYILRRYEVSFLKISAFLISYPTYFIELVPTLSHCLVCCFCFGFFFFFPVPCLYSLNKICLDLQYYFLSLVLKPWQYEQSIQVLTLSLGCPVWCVNERANRSFPEAKEELSRRKGWCQAECCSPGSVLVPLLWLRCCALEAHLKKMHLWWYRLLLSPPPSRLTLQCSSSHSNAAVLLRLPKVSVETMTFLLWYPWLCL